MKELDIAIQEHLAHGTDGLGDIEVRELHALGCQSVDIGSLESFGTKASEIAISPPNQRNGNEKTAADMMMRNTITCMLLDNHRMFWSGVLDGRRVDGREWE